VGRERISGTLIGLMALVKPQYAFICVWFAVRKKWGALWASLATGAAGLVVATEIFGWREQLKYIAVAREASRGYAYYPNLSINGFMNRLIFNGPNLTFDPASYAPPSLLVSAAGTVGLLALLCAALLFPRSSQARGGVLDFCAVALASTAASPMAWEHHYGILFPIFMASFALLKWRASRETAAAYLVTGNAWSVMNVFAGIPGVNALQSIPFFGVLLTLATLWRSQKANLNAGHDALE
jgi:hypothetical protein